MYRQKLRIENTETCCRFVVPVKLALRPGRKHETTGPADFPSIRNSGNSGISRSGRLPKMTVGAVLLVAMGVAGFVLQLLMVGPDWGRIKEFYSTSAVGNHGRRRDTRKLKCSRAWRYCEKVADEAPVRCSGH
jgi:hypothetical protein